MTAVDRPWAREILRVWFHDLSPADWFGGDDAVDAMLRRKFGGLWSALRHRPAYEFLHDHKLALAAILLFDQIPRNLHRGEASAFASDALARSLTHTILARNWLEHYSSEQKQFALMPLMHSERIADQRLSLMLFARHVPSALAFARSHWRMVARFGRFPHRNDTLGRPSTPAEKRAVEAGFSW